MLFHFLCTLTTRMFEITCFISLCRDKAVLLSVMMFSLYTAIDIGFNDIYSVWAKTSPHLGTAPLASHQHTCIQFIVYVGGLGLSLNVIGITLTVSSALLLPIGLVIFPLVSVYNDSIPYIPCTR